MKLPRNLRQMMFEMPDVIFGEFFERHRRVITDTADRARFRRRYRIQHVRKESIVAGPQLHQVRPAALLILLDMHTAWLIIARPNQLVL